MYTYVTTTTFRKFCSVESLINYFFSRGNIVNFCTLRVIFPSFILFISHSHLFPYMRLLFVVSFCIISTLSTHYALPKRVAINQFGDGVMLLN